ncbi:MAG TPA: glycoside hydrolase family 3 C-terminal domain-containing protein [Candidatus Nesterenkonia stercoripullorum]|uniref:Glycoside hydrolase family 3 C-terminal domain-containing protein n=1 Tax=Candidatus Nesterenkonia stercoripullorum TaxID=2838701 RepID=A0A9D1UUX8_9MICC|nr:glycoside hydrolase family 3 C-terminal domain-containing protein [Candidatus Nesterenkonia stercoripullorum]
MSETSSSLVTGIWNDPSLPVAERVSALLAEMTIEEKVAQLGAHWEQHRGDDVQGDVAPMQDAMSASQLPWDQEIVDGLGHLTRVFGTEPVDVGEGVSSLRRQQSEVMSANRFGIPALAHEECLTGFTAYRATVYPTSLAWGATFDVDLIRDMARRIGEDMAAVGVHQGLAPVLDVVRDPRWGRVEETMGEDPYLIGQLGVGYVQGLQSAGVLATLKHFAGYSASKAARNHAPVSMGRRELIDVLFYPFECAVREGGVASVMNSYADIDGEAPAASHWLLTDVLRDEWGFSGSVVSDYWSVAFLESMHRVAADQVQAARLAVSAGLDVELPQTGGYRTLAAQVRQGELPEAVIDRAAARVLTHKVELGLLEAGWESPADQNRDLDSPGNRELARTIAQRSLVLLSNDGTLPLPAEAKSSRIAVIGPSAEDASTMMGCYSFPNHVLAKYPEGSFPAGGLGIEVPTVLAAARARFQDAEVSYSRGCPIIGYEDSGIADAVTLAEQADTVILTVGDKAGMFGAGTSGEGCDAADLELPGAQQELVEAVLETGTPVVLVVISGRPYALGGVAERCAAVVQGFFPGEEGAAALLDLLAGDIEPSGRLPIGVPRSPGGQPAGYLAAPLGQNSQGVSNLDPTPLFPFGHGLSYTQIAYRGMTLSSDEIGVDGTLTATVTVANDGDRPARELVQLYAGDRVAQVARPVRQLIGFAHVDLKPGEERQVDFTVHADLFSFIGVDYRRIVEPGVVDLWSGRSAGDLPLSSPLDIHGELREVRGERVLSTMVNIR